MGCLGIFGERAGRDLAWKPTWSVPALSVLQLLLPSDLKIRERGMTWCQLALGLNPEVVDFPIRL